jgi:hypothetical protein
MILCVVLLRHCAAVVHLWYQTAIVIEICIGPTLIATLHVSKHKTEQVNVYLIAHVVSRLIAKRSRRKCVGHSVDKLQGVYIGILAHTVKLHMFHGETATELIPQLYML